VHRGQGERRPGAGARGEEGEEVSGLVFNPAPLPGFEKGPRAALPTWRAA
jgi:hypothetical protein